MKLKPFLAAALPVAATLAFFFNPQLALATENPEKDEKSQTTNAEHLEKIASQMKMEDLQNALGSGVIKAAHEAGTKDPIILPADAAQVLKEISVAKEVVLLNRGHDLTRLFAAAVIRHLHRMGGHWEASEFEERTILRKKSKGKKRVERIFVTVKGITPEVFKEWPIVFASGPEFLEAMFLLMTLMHLASKESDLKKQLEFVPLMNAWRVVARQEMAYFAYATFPFKHALKALSALPASKAQADHLAQIEQLQLSIHKDERFSHLEKDDIEIQLDLSDPMEEAAFKQIIHHKIPLVNYHRHGSYFREALESKGALFIALGKGDATSSDLAQSLLYRSISMFFQHSENAEIKHFLSLKFWKDEATATRVMEDILAQTHRYVSETVTQISEKLEKDLSAADLTREINDQFATAGKEAKAVAERHKSRIEASMKSFIEFAKSKSPETVGVLISEHKTRAHPWLKDLVFLHDEVSQFCSTKPTFCKILLRELHKLHPKAKNALAVEEFKMMLRGILAFSGVIKQEKLLTTMTKELQWIGTKLEIQKPPETEKEIEAVEQKIEEKKEEEENQKEEEKQIIEEAEQKDEGAVETTNAGEGENNSNDHPHEDFNKDDSGGNIGGTAFVWNDLKQFQVYAMLRIALQSLAYALTHPSQNGKVPYHLLSRLASDCYFLGKHPDVQQKIKRAAEESSEAKEIKRFDKYFAGFLAICCTLLAAQVYVRTMEENALGSPIEEDAFNEEFGKAFEGMDTWRNRLIMPELQEKGKEMETGDVKEMKFEFVRDAMDQALKALESIATAIKPECSSAKDLPTIPPHKLDPHLSDFSFNQKPLEPIRKLTNAVCYAYYLNTGLIIHLSGTAEDTTPYAVKHDIVSLPKESVIKESPVKYYPVCLRLMKTLTANDFGTWLEPPFAKVLSASALILSTAPQLEKSNKSFAQFKQCIRKAEGDTVEQFSLIPQMLHFDMQPGVCDFLGLKKLKQKYDLVAQALKKQGNHMDILTKVEEKEKIVASRLVAVSCLLDKRMLRTISKHIRLAVQGMQHLEADKAALEANIKRVIAFETHVKECNAEDELAVIQKLKEHEAAHKEADNAEDVAEGEEAEAEAQTAENDASEAENIEQEE